MTRPRVLVVGSGGLGGVLSAILIEHGAASIVTLGKNRAIADAVAARGFLVHGVDGERVVQGSVVPDLAGQDPFSFVILATQPPQVEEAARAVARHLAPDGVMVCLQNGLCEERVAAIIGRDRVVGAVVAWGATMPEPGVYDRTAAGGFTMGRLDGSSDPRVAELATLLEPVGPVTLTANLAGARWSKLAINCAISTLGTLSGGPLGGLLVHRFARRLALEVMTEVVSVARAENVRLEKVSGTLDLGFIALTDADRRSVGSPSLLAKHAVLLAVGARYRRMRSSMLSAIERGREPAIDFLNGEVVDRGKRHEIPTPVNEAAADAVRALAAGRMVAGMDTVRALERLLD